MIRVTIDRDGCTSCASCWLDCPEVFEESSEDKLSQIVENYRTGGIGEGEAPDDLEDCITQACEDCPVSVIRVS